jgi:hypothetical protein
MKGNTMRKLVDLNGNFVPTKQAYGEAAKGSIKSIVLYGIVVVAFNIWAHKQLKKDENLLQELIKYQ